MSETRWLDDREAAAWLAVRTLGQPLWTALGRDLQHDSGLSMADYQVLVVLSARSSGTLPYRDLVAETRWEKSRLSHHLTRMEQRRLVERRNCASDARSADVVLTPRGRAAIEGAAPGHVRSVRRLLIDRLSDEQIDTLAAIGNIVSAELAACDPTVDDPSPEDDPLTVDNAPVVDGGPAADEPPAEEPVDRRRIADHLGAEPGTGRC